MAVSGYAEACQYLANWLLWFQEDGFYDYSCRFSALQACFLLDRPRQYANQSRLSLKLEFRAHAPRGEFGTVSEAGGSGRSKDLGRDPSRDPGRLMV